MHRRRIAHRRMHRRGLHRRRIAHRKMHRRGMHRRRNACFFLLLMLVKRV
jgi:hypothetical protein